MIVVFVVAVPHWPRQALPKQQREDKCLRKMRWFPWNLFFALHFCFTCRSREMKQKLNQRSAWKLKAREMNWEWFGWGGAYSLVDMGQLRRSIITCHINILRNILIKRTLKNLFSIVKRGSVLLDFTSQQQQLVIERVTFVIDWSPHEDRLNNVAGRQVLIAMRRDF